MNLPEALPETSDLRLKSLYNWLNRLRDYSASCHPRVGAGTRLQHGASGFSYSAPPAAPGLAGLLLNYQSSSDNYIVCVDADGNTRNVAKPWILRRTTYDGLTVVLLDGSHVYSYVSADKRTDASTAPDSSALTVDAVIWPQYTAGCQIVALQPSGGPNAVDLNGDEIMHDGDPIDGTGVLDASGKPVTLLEVSSRFWKNNSAVCYDGFPGFLLTDSNFYGGSI